jgi:hypothetical protein
MKCTLLTLTAVFLTPLAALTAAQMPVKVFVLAGQSNMEGADSKVKDIQRFPSFAGLDMPQEKILFSYNIGREEKQASQGWVALQPVRKLVGPELSFARRVAQETKARIAIIKCAAGGTDLERP